MVNNMEVIQIQTGGSSVIFKIYGKKEKVSNNKFLEGLLQSFADCKILENHQSSPFFCFIPPFLGSFHLPPLHHYWDSLDFVTYSNFHSPLKKGGVHYVWSVNFS